MRVLLDEMSIWISGLSKGDFPPQCGWALPNPSKAWTEQNVEEGGSRFFFFLPHWLSWDISFYIPLPLDWDLHHQLPWLAGLHTQAQTQLHQWLSWAFNLQMADGRTSQPPLLHEPIPHSTSPFLYSYLSIYLSMYLHPTSSVLWRTLTYSGGYPSILNT